MKPYNNPPRIVIAAPHSGAGKTTLSLGIMAALTKRGLNVQPFKVGPDYIDPAFHTEVTKHTSVNLDSWLFEKETILNLFGKYASKADISIIEGVMGLYDGVGIDPMVGSSAAMANILKAPIILVMPARGMSTTIAAVVSGLKEFRKINIAGVILNQVSSIKYYELLKNAIETHTGVRVVGRLPVVEDITLKSRHLGLVQNCELLNKSDIIDRLIELVEEYVDLDKILDISNMAEELNYSLEEEEKLKVGPNSKVINIAIAYDEAFQFYYHENLEILKSLGASIKFFSPLKDKKLPEDISGIYIGGGYPELYAKDLERNVGLRNEIKKMSELGMPIYGECGGYMYLNRKIKTLENEEYNMVGIFDGEVLMSKGLQNFGYAELTAVEDSCIFKTGDRIKSHEFHTSIVEQQRNIDLVQAEKNVNGDQISWYCGSKMNNTFGMYPHVHFLSNINIAENFIESCKKYKGLGD